jgi:hypothetical protein
LYWNYRHVIPHPARLQVLSKIINALGMEMLNLRLTWAIQVEMSTNLSTAWKRGWARGLRVTGVKSAANQLSRENYTSERTGGPEIH